MEPSDESLEIVFNALDTEHKGFITVDQFTNTFREFYQSTSQLERRVSTAPCDIEKIVGALDPQSDGVIHFEDFKKAFQGKLEEIKQMGDSPDDYNGEYTAGFTSPQTGINKSFLLSEANENKTDDSGVHITENNPFDFDSDSVLSADMMHGSHLQRDEIRRSWPKHRGPPYSDARGSISPVSASRSEILMGDVESNLELINDRMRRMEERVAGIHASNRTGAEMRIDTLRDENARLTAQITVLEERLREADARAIRNVESERQHLQSMMSRATREHAAEVETLRTRISSLETECSDLRIEAARVKAENQVTVLDRRRNSEALSEAQDQVRILQQQIKGMEKKHAQEIEVLRKDRDHAVRVLEELNNSIGERRRSRMGSSSLSPSEIADGTEVMARYRESQEIVRRLITENKDLRKNLEDAQDQLFARSLEEGRSLLRPSEKSWASEIDNCTKEEVVELWTTEKHINEQLRKYIDSLITRIMEKHPSLLEVASSTPSAAAAT